MSKATQIIDQINESYVIIQRANGDSWASLAYCMNAQAAHELANGAFVASRGKVHYRIVQNREVIGTYPKDAVSTGKPQDRMLQDFGQGANDMKGRLATAGKQAVGAAYDYMKQHGKREQSGKI